MAYKDLQAFIKTLKSHDELIEINEEVDANLEITEISDRIMKSTSQNKALLFNHIKESPYPLLINAFGSNERMALAFEVDQLDQIANDIKYFLNLANYKTLPKQIKSLPKLARLYFSFPRKVKKAACQEVVEDPNLNHIPILKCWPEDGGKFFTLPLVITKDPETGQQNMGMYRMQVYDHKTTGMHWHWHKDGREIYDKYRKMGITKMPVSVVVGSDPATVYAATAPLPKMIDEMMLSSFLRKRPLSIVKCKTNNIYVPANAEFVFEGYVDISEGLRLEGPFGDHTGYYSLPDMYPVFHIEKVTRRKNPVFHATIVGVAPMEDCYLGLATEKIFIPLLQLTTPEVVNLHMPFEGVFHNFAITSIKKHFPKHAHKVLSSLWGTGQMMYEKLICIVDENKDLKNYFDLFWTVIDHVNLGEDLVITEGPLDALDHSSKKAFYGARVGIDATTKLPQEIDSTYDEQEFYLTNINKQTVFNELKEKFDYIIDIRLPQNDHYNKVLLISINKTTTEEVKHLNEYLRSHKDYSHFKFIAFFDQFTEIQNTSMTFWRLFNNIDAKRDFFFHEIIEKSQTFTTLTIDATRKLPIENGNRNWPNDIIMDPEIINKVNEKWLNYGFIKETN